MIQLKYQLGRITQFQHSSKLMAQPAAGGFDTAAKFFFVFQAHHREPDFTVTQVARCLYPGDADHALLHTRIFDIPQLGGNNALNIVIDSCNFIG